MRMNFGEPQPASGRSRHTFSRQPIETERVVKKDGQVFAIGGKGQSHLSETCGGTLSGLAHVDFRYWLVSAPIHNHDFAGDRFNLRLKRKASTILRVGINMRMWRGIH